VGSPPTFRINGTLVRIDAPPLDRDEMHALVFGVLTDEQKARFEDSHDLDFALELKDVGRFRVNAFVNRLGEAMVMRLIPEKNRSLDELGMPPILKELSMKDRGLVLVTGPTGSGKTTTLAAMVDYMNNSREDHILTIEDPIEFIHEDKKCNINQREIGPNTKSFGTALRGALREDPDIILVGEMRDQETIRLAIEAAATGHLVFGTLHTTNAPKTVDRIVEVFPHEEQSQIRNTLSTSLKVIVAQTLFKRVDQKGRCAALEIMVCTTAIANLIRESKTTQMLSMIQTGKKAGMQRLYAAML